MLCLKMNTFHKNMKVALWLGLFWIKEAKLRSSSYVSKIPVTKFIIFNPLKIKETFNDSPY